jgi:hypothetical protein
MELGRGALVYPASPPLAPNVNPAALAASLISLRGSRGTELSALK